jgi:hypothetical protein
MKANQLIFTVLASLCLTNHASSGQIEQQAINEIKPGITTETDLVHRFGPPDTRVVDIRGNRVLHWIKLGAPPLRGYLPVIGPWLGVQNVSWQDLWAQVRANGRVEYYTLKMETADCCHPTGRTFTSQRETR